MDIVWIHRLLVQPSLNVRALLLVAFFLSSQVLWLSSVSANSCNAQNIATVSCNAVFDPGVVRSFSNDYRHVGNPIDVVSGSKQQHELDFQAIGSPLHFSRYYHSSLVEDNYALGQGWRHSYLVKLYVVDDNTMRIQQADGRWITFTLKESKDALSVFQSSSENDGYLEENDSVVWKVPDGRTMHFQGSFLTRIEYPHGFDLTLLYKQKRLSSVTDQQGRSLSFEYTMGRNGLADYEQSQSGIVKGHLSAVKLPSGERIHYLYDGNRNLIKAQYSDSQSSEYEYKDADFPHHLNSVIKDVSAEDGHRTWVYDDSGRVISYEDVIRDILVSLEYEVNANGGVTKVVYSYGREEIYTWASGVNGINVNDVEIKDCADCEFMIWRSDRQKSNVRDKPVDDDEQPVALDSSRAEQSKKEAEGDDDLVARQAEIPTNPNPNPNPKSKSKRVVQQFDVGLFYEFPNYDELIAVPGTSDLTTEITLDSTTFSFYVEAMRDGRVGDITVGSTSLTKLQSHWHEGTLERCDFQPLFERSLIYPATEKGCLEDLHYLVELTHHIQNLTKEHGLEQPKSLERNGTDSGFLNECSVNPFGSCDELERDFQLAQLSQCAYQDFVQVCGDDWQVVSPESIGLTDTLFEKGAFAATLFFNAVNKEYVLAFRGTDGLGDWKDNILQSSGKLTSQYRRAVALAKKLRQTLPKSLLGFTGHSLGGGLATAAALSIDALANVFNPAGFKHKAATKLGLEVYKSYDLVKVTTVEGDALTKFQESGKNQYPAPGRHTKLTAPPFEWIEEKKKNAGFFGKNDGVILHSIDAVLAAQEGIINNYCDKLPSKV